MNRFVAILCLFPVLACAQNTNYNVGLVGKVNFSGKGRPHVSHEIFVDSFTTFEQGNVGDLVTLDYLTNSTTAVGAFGWAYVPVSGGNTTFKRTYVGSNTYALPDVSIAMGSGQYQTTGTRSIQYDSTTNAVNEVMEFILPGGAGGNKTVVSFGMLVQFCATNSSATFVTNRFVTLNGPPYGACEHELSDTLNRIRAVGTLDDGTLTGGGAIPIVPCKMYWLTGVRNVTESHCSMSLYDPTTGGLVGESVAALGTTNVTWNIQLGNTTTDLSTSGNVYWDNLIVNYHDAFYPLGPTKTTPPAPSQAPPQSTLLSEDGSGILGESTESILIQ